MNKEDSVTKIKYINSRVSGNQIIIISDDVLGI